MACNQLRTGRRPIREGKPTASPLVVIVARTVDDPVAAAHDRNARVIAARKLSEGTEEGRLFLNLLRCALIESTHK